MKNHIWVWLVSLVCYTFHLHNELHLTSFLLMFWFEAVEPEINEMKWIHSAQKLENFSFFLLNGILWSERIYCRKFSFAFQYFFASFVGNNNLLVEMMVSLWEISFLLEVLTGLQCCNFLFGWIDGTRLDACRIWVLFFRKICIHVACWTLLTKSTQTSVG